MSARILRLLPVIAALALALALTGSAELSVIAAGVALLAATAVVAVVVLRAATSGTTRGRDGAWRPLLTTQPAPCHPDTDGRARPRAPGSGPIAA
jgi:hypothetical protein